MRQNPAAINIATVAIKFRRLFVFFPMLGMYFTHYILCIGLRRNGDARVRCASLACILTHEACTRVVSEWTTQYSRRITRSDPVNDITASTKIAMASIRIKILLSSFFYLFVSGFVGLKKQNEKHKLQIIPNLSYF